MKKRFYQIKVGEKFTTKTVKNEIYVKVGKSTASFRDYFVHINPFETVTLESIRIGEESLC